MHRKLLDCTVDRCPKQLLFQLLIGLDRVLGEARGLLLRVGQIGQDLVGIFRFGLASLALKRAVGSCNLRGLAVLNGQLVLLIRKPNLCIEMSDSITKLYGHCVLAYVGLFSKER